MKIRVFDDSDRLVFESAQGSRPSLEIQDATAAVLQAVPQINWTRRADLDPAKANVSDVSFAAQQITPDLENQPELAATVFIALGRAYLNSGQLGLGCQLIERAAELRARMFDPSHPALAEVSQMLARIQRDEGNLAEAEANVRQAFATQTATGQAGSLAVVPTLWELSVIQNAAGQFAAAEDSVAEGLKIIESLGLEHTDLYVPRFWQSRGQALHARGDPAKAIEWFVQARIRSLRQLGPDSHEYASYLHDIGLAQADMGQVDAAEANFREAIRIYAAINNRHPNLSVKYVNLGRLLLQKGAQFREEARQAYRRAMAISAHTRGTRHPYYAFDQTNLAGLEFECGNLTEACALFQEALATFRQRTELGKAHAAGTLTSLARIYLESHAPENPDSKTMDVADPLQKALTAIREALTIFEQEPGEPGFEYAYARAVLGRTMYLASPAPDEARAMLAESHRIILEKLGQGSRYAAVVARWVSAAAAGGQR